MVGESWQTDDTRALFDAILGLEGTGDAERFFRDLCTMGELHDMAQRWAVVRLLDDGPPLRRDLAPDRREHRDDHPDRVVAQPRRGRLSRRRSTGSRPTQARREGPSPAKPRRGGRAYEGAPPARRSRTRAGSSSRRSRCSTTPASSSRSTTGASSRASRTCRSTSCSSARTTSSSSSATASPTSGSPARTCSPRPAPSCRVLRSLGYGRCRLAAAVPTDAPIQDDRRTSPACGSRPPTRTSTRRFFADRRIAGRHHPDLGRGRGRAAARAGRGASSTSCRPARPWR